MVVVEIVITYAKQIARVHVMEVAKILVIHYVLAVVSAHVAETVITGVTSVV